MTPATSNNWTALIGWMINSEVNAIDREPIRSVWGNPSHEEDGDMRRKNVHINPQMKTQNQEE